MVLNRLKKCVEKGVESVADNGIGIPKESIHRITERFFTVDPSKSRSVGGTGLGLAIVKHLVTQHRAEMLINSVENQGTTIDIKFKSKVVNCCNGGRYDKLISDLGAKKQTPAVGAALNLIY